MVVHQWGWGWGERGGDGIWVCDASWLGWSVPVMGGCRGGGGGVVLVVVVVVVDW